MLNLTVSGAGTALLAVYVAWRIVETLQGQRIDGTGATVRRVLMTAVDIFTLLLGSVWFWVGNMVLSSALVLFSDFPENTRLRREHEPRAIRIGLTLAILLEAALYFGFQSLR
jgi:hypothetical protein